MDGGGRFIAGTLNIVISRQQREPCFHVLLKRLLGLEVVGYHNDRALREMLPEQSRKKGPGGGANAGTRQYSAIRHTPDQ